MAQGHKVCIKPTGCGFDPHSRRLNIYLNLYFHFFALVSRQSAVLGSATQHAMPPEFSRKWQTECLNTRFPLTTLLCAGYSVKLNWIELNWNGFISVKVLNRIMVFTWVLDTVFIIQREKIFWEPVLHLVWPSWIRSTKRILTTLPRIRVGPTQLKLTTYWPDSVILVPY